MAYQPIPRFKEGDAGTTGTDSLVPVLGRRNDTNAARADVDGDYVALNVDSAGRQKLGASDQVIGHVVVDSGAITITPSGTQDVNLTKVSGTAVTLGQKAMAASIPVVLPSDQTSIPVAATLSAETTKVIGTVNQGTSPWVVSGTVTANQGGAPWSVSATDLDIRDLAFATDKVDVSGSVVGAVVTNAGTFAVQDAAAEASLSVIDDWDESDRAKVNPIAGQAGVQGGSGAVNALTQRVVLATDVALPAGTNVIGHVVVDSGSITVTPSGTQDVNLTKVGSVAVALGQAAMAASFPVVLASDQSSIPVAATLSAETTKVIGVVRTADGVGNLLSSTSNALDVNLKTSSITLAVSMATNTPVGSIAHDGAAAAVAPLLFGGYASAAAPTDVSADNDAVRAWFLRNGAQAVNLTAAGALIGATSNALDVNVKSTAAGSVSLAAETTKVIGTVRNLGNAGAIFDGVIGAATAPANMIVGGGVYNSTELTLTTGQSSAIQLDSKGRTRTVLMDAATNSRGANVDSNNNLGVVLPAETTKVIGTIRNVGNVGGVFDGVNTAATAPANGILGLGIYNSTEPSPTTGQSVGIQLDSKGRQRMVIMDAAGNTRGANVDSNNNMGVVLAAETTKVIGTVNIAASQTIAVTQATASSLNAQVVGSIAHDGVDSGNPVKIGMRAIAHGTNPTAVAAADRTDWLANRAGVPFVIGGHPNIQTVEYRATSATSGTDVSLLGNIATGTKVVITAIEALCSNANTVNVKVRIGFGTANVPSDPSTGNTVAGMVLVHSGIAPGSGVVLGNGSGILAVGADDQELRVTHDAPTTGELRIRVSYYTIES